MLRKILVRIVSSVRKEEIQIGEFSDLDIIRIFLKRGIGLLRGFFYINILAITKGVFFVGNRVTIMGREKIHFSSGTTLGNNVKLSALGSIGFYIGNNFSIKDYSIIDSFGSIKKESGTLRIGNNVGISENAYFGIRGNLTIGNDVIFGPGVKIFTENHSMMLNGEAFRLQNEIRKDVTIGNNIWIGAGVIILAGVNIGDNSVIAAGSVVTSSIEAGSIYAGVPARFLKKV
jgi:acetyltransferase-like isoleucine patch superfamily enzyme